MTDTKTVRTARNLRTGLHVRLTTRSYSYTCRVVRDARRSGTPAEMVEEHLGQRLQILADSSGGLWAYFGGCPQGSKVDGLRYCAPGGYLRTPERTMLDRAGR